MAFKNNGIKDGRKIINKLLIQIKKNITKYGIYYLFLLPFLIPFSLFLVYPLINAFIYSFHKYNLSTYKFIGLDNYIKILNDPLFRRSIITTCYFVIGAVPSIIFITILLSSLLIKMKDKLRTLFMGIFYLPTVTTVIFFVLSWKLVYDYRYGILNFIMRLLGYENINWLSNKYTVIPSLVAMIVYGTLGVPIILYISAMAAIPKSLYEVAKIDGATEWQILKNITIPLIMPTTLYIMITLTIGVFQTFILVYLMTGGGPYYRTMTMNYFMVQEAFTNSNFGMSSAIGIVFLFMISILVIIQYRFFSKEIEY